VAQHHLRVPGRLRSSPASQGTAQTCGTPTSLRGRAQQSFFCRYAGISRATWCASGFRRAGWARVSSG